MNQRTNPPELRVYDSRSQDGIPFDEWNERLQRQATSRRLWARVGLVLTIIALLVTIGIRIWRG